MVNHWKYWFERSKREQKVINIKNKRRNITADPTEIFKKWENINANKFNNLDEMEKLRITIIPTPLSHTHMHTHRENLNRSMCTKLNSQAKKLAQKENTGPRRFHWWTVTHSDEVNAIPVKNPTGYFIELTSWFKLSYGNVKILE